MVDSVDSRAKQQILAWVSEYRKASGRRREELGTQAESFLAAIETTEDRVWFDAVSSHLDDSTPLEIVGSSGDLAVAEFRSLMMGP